MQHDVSLENSAYLDTLFETYRTAPHSLSPEWQSYFEQLMRERPHSPPSTQFTSHTSINSPATAMAVRMISNFRTWGFLSAQLDPLNLTPPPSHPELSLDYYINNTSVYAHDPVFLSADEAHFGTTLGEVWKNLTALYSGSLAAEFMHIQNPEHRQFIQHAFEGSSKKPTFSVAQKKDALRYVMQGELFEQFLHKKFPGAKRFGLDGGESLMPLLHQSLVLSRHPAHMGYTTHTGVQTAVIGIAHRGRLNVLTNILKKSYRKLFAKFIASKDDPYATGSGDVKYHLGYSHDTQIDGAPLHISLMYNPSHLEAVNPVVLGKVRAEQDNLHDHERAKIMGILIHGDAAFAGQGLVCESLELCALPGYCTGGTLHIIINNQIGFTTSPQFSRSSPHASDVAKTIQAPILHVNGDDMEAVLRAGFIANAYRTQFHHDIVINLMCYRRLGHNESDEPRFTQPKMYAAIKSHPTTATRYGDQLVNDGVISHDERDTLTHELQSILDEEYTRAVAYDDCFDHPFWLQGAWKDIIPTPKDDTSFEHDAQTGVSAKHLRDLGQILFRIPDQVYKKDGVATSHTVEGGLSESFHVNAKIARQLSLKQKMMESGQGIDWGTAEALSFASLISQGHPIRLSGQDCGRGTFSHRHAVFVDQEDESRYYPLDHIQPNRAMFHVIDSPLSEAAVLGFEYGYSSATPHGLTLWEAQFGDFANGAQVMIDQFLSSGDMKWARQNGLVLLLPHGFEGQGPEHSSARLERFLQLCAEGNWCVANCSTPASYFHIVRRQIKQPYRRPLILMTPKSLLRHPQCTSRLEEFDGVFQPVIAPFLHGQAPALHMHHAAALLHPNGVNPSTITRVIVCAGKVFYDLLAYAQDCMKNGDSSPQNTVLIRLEQFYPWPDHHLQQALSPYAHCEFVWCQEEPENMGAWHFLSHRLEHTLKSCGALNPRPSVIARPASSSPATGIVSRHEKECINLYKSVFEL